MTKDECIRRYGLEWYKQHQLRDSEYRERHNARYKERYRNDSEYRGYKRARQMGRYVEDDRIDLVENYELAAQDNLDGWDIHHRLELHPDGSIRFTRRSLIKLDLYYNRPPSELIWLRESEHVSLHNSARSR